MALNQQVPTPRIQPTPPLATAKMPSVSASETKNVPAETLKKKGLLKNILIILLVIILGAGLFYVGYILGQKAITPQTPLPTPELIVTPTPPAGLKTYNNNQFGTYDYQVHYPSDWKVNNIFQPNADVVRFTPVNVVTDDFIAINCPTDSSTKKEMSKPWEWESTEYEYMGGYNVKFFKKTQINGFEAIQYVSSPRDINQTQTGEFLTTEILRDDRTAVCIITTTINEAPGDTVEKRATSKVIYQQVVSSFKYGNNDNLNVKTHCVVTGNRGQLCLEANQEPPHTGELPVTQEYECLDYAICEKQINGSCGWTLTEGYNKCMGR